LIAAVVILGVVVSWIGTWLWNLASARLSPVLAGLLVNVETIAGFAYVYAAKLQWPPPGQLAGLLLVITGVALAVRRQQPGPADASRREPPASSLTKRVPAGGTGQRLAPRRHRAAAVRQIRRACRPR
jgi:hypothetical protein